MKFLQAFPAIGCHKQQLPLIQGPDLLQKSIPVDTVIFRQCNSEIHKQQFTGLLPEII
jgi:hypothetical protein